MTGKMNKKSIITLILSILIFAAVSGCGNTRKVSGVGDNAIPSSNGTGSTETGEEAEGGRAVSEAQVSEETVSENSRYGKVADVADDTAPEETDDSNLTPVTASELNKGEYLIETGCSSPGFEIADTLLMAEDVSMNAVLRIESDEYLFIYPGTASEAASDSEDNYISPAQNDAGDRLYKIPVEALDKALSYAAYSGDKGEWYDRTLLFKSSSLPDEAFKESRYKTAKELKIEDGMYYIDVDTEGISGEDSIGSPALLLIQEGEAAAMITWASPDHEHMTVDGMEFDADKEDEEASFVIPVKSFDQKLSVTADTAEITLYFDSATITAADPDGEAPAYKSMKIREKIIPEYATGFKIDSYDNNIYRITAGKDRYLLVPRLALLPSGIPADVTVIRTPVRRAYVASASGMDFFSQLDSLGNVGFSGCEADEITESKASALVEADDIHYAGWDDASDSEELIKSRPDLAVADGQTGQNDETGKKLKELSISVFADRSGSEEDPRGKAEWIRIYGLLNGEYGRALRIFDAECKKIDAAEKDDMDSAD